MEPDMLHNLLVLGMLLDLLQALDLVKMLRLLLPLEDLHLNLWNRMSLVNLRMELGQGMQKGMALDHEGTNQHLNRLFSLSASTTGIN